MPCRNLSSRSAAICCLIVLILIPLTGTAKTRLVDTGQRRCYHNTKEILCPMLGSMGLRTASIFTTATMTVT